MNVKVIFSAILTFHVSLIHFRTHALNFQVIPYFQDFLGTLKRLAQCSEGLLNSLDIFN